MAMRVKLIIRGQSIVVFVEQKDIVFIRNRDAMLRSMIMGILCKNRFLGVNAKFVLGSLERNYTMERKFALGGRQP